MKYRCFLLLLFIAAKLAAKAPQEEYSPKNHHAILITFMKKLGKSPCGNSSIDNCYLKCMSVFEKEIAKSEEETEESDLFQYMASRTPKEREELFSTTKRVIDKICNGKHP